MLRAWIDENDIRLEIEDQGKGIENIEQAMQPFYTSHPEQERTGMGFALMQSFMDQRPRSVLSGNGTIVFMRKRLHENDE
ncbi:MAG: ATP-binding protein [Christensenellales bacterium]